MKRLDPSPQTIHWGYFDGSLKPVMEVDDGEVITIANASGFPDDDVPPDWIPPAVHLIHAQVKDRGPGPHVITGPVFVRGAKPGDVLEVEIRDIQLAAKYGHNLTRPLTGMFPEAMQRPRKEMIPIDREAGVALLPPNIKVPTHPFFGILAVAPPREWGRIDSLFPRAHGGNMDIKELKPGARLFLPVWVEGALFSVGDGHAAQGDGEVNLTAVETCLEGVFRLRVRREFQTPAPFAVTQSHLITMAWDEDLDEAARSAVRHMIQLLGEHCHLSFNDAYQLCSIAVDLRVAQMIAGLKGIYAMLNLSLLADLDHRPVFLD